MVRFKLNKFEYVQGGGYVEGGPCMVGAGRGLWGWDQGPGTRDSRM